MTCGILQGLTLDRISSVVKAASRTVGWYLEMVDQCIGGARHCKKRTGGLGDWTSRDGDSTVSNGKSVLGRDAKIFTAMECSSFGSEQQ